jgi:hypothetical protein
MVGMGERTFLLNQFHKSLLLSSAALPRIAEDISVRGWFACFQVVLMSGLTFLFPSLSPLLLFEYEEVGQVNMIKT